MDVERKDTVVSMPTESLNVLQKCCSHTILSQVMKTSCSQANKDFSALASSRMVVLCWPTLCRTIGLMTIAIVASNAIVHHKGPRQSPAPDSLQMTFYPSLVPLLGSFILFHLEASQSFGIVSYQEIRLLSDSLLRVL